MTEQKGLIFRFGEFEVREREFCLFAAAKRFRWNRRPSACCCICCATLTG